MHAKLIFTYIKHDFSKNSCNYGMQTEEVLLIQDLLT
jgi:hypothetical protein